MANASLFLLLIFIAPVSMFDPAYCKLNPMHIMCITPEKVSVCKVCIPWPIDDNLRIEILHMHNSWRQNVSVGNETRGKEGMQPPASNMMRMHWDYELAKIAQRKANQCLFQQDCRDCNSVLDGRFKVGQNLALFRTINRKNFTKTEFFKAMKSWYESEVFYATRYSVEHYRKHLISHYGQIIAWNARAIGCGASEFIDGIFHKLLIVCNYGNLIEEGAQLYKIQSPCSDCPDETICDSSYFGLCVIKNPNFKVESKFEPTDGKIIEGLRRWSHLNQG
ncbi:UNVERIFIED_CONTAM: hypothetical protein RMT77_017544 [Armadillidium vulgare]